MRGQEEKEHGNREDVRGARRKRGDGGTNGKREDRDRKSRKKHGAVGAGKGEGKEGIWDIFTELLK